MKLYDYEKDEKIFAQEKRKNFLVRFFAVFLGILVMLSAIVLGIRVNMNPIKRISGGDSKLMIQPVSFDFREDPKEVGAVESMIEYEKNHAFGIHFPKLEDESTNQAIRKDIDQMVSGFKDELKDYEAESPDKRAIYTVDYDIFSNTDRYLSVVYHIEKKLPQQDQTIQMIRTRVYDLSKGQELPLSEIFEESFLSKISGLVSDYFASGKDYQEKQKAETFEKRTAPEWEQYQNISFSDGLMTVYFNRAEELFEGMQGVLSIPFSIEKVIDTMKINITGYTAPVLPSSDIDPNKPMVALTFDDGPYPKVTERILDQLEQNNGRATFFILGNRIQGNENTLKRADSLGCEIASHTYDHKNLTKLTPDQIKGEVNTTNDLVNGVLSKGTIVVRPPYGAINDIVRANIGKPMITWSLDTLDWKTKDSACTIPNILNNVQDGDIILMHDLYSATADACDSVIPELTRRGYQLVTVSELMAARGVSMEPGKTYYKARP